MTGRPQRIEPGPGQESVWDYPRPPIVVPFDGRVRVIHAGVAVADTTAAARILETSQPPAFYLPLADVRMDLLRRSTNRTLCEWKGAASYWSLDSIDGRPAVPDVAWAYPQASGQFAAIRDHLAFYAQKVDECWVDDDRAEPNPGWFYGGWITAKIVGPFKGAPGTLHW